MSRKRMGATTAAGALLLTLLGTSPAGAAPGDVTRLAGDDRYATAAAAALQGWTQASTVVVASGRGGTDALAAASLAGSLGAPVLLTDRDQAPAATVRALASLGADRVVVLGGESAVSPAAYAQFTAGRNGTRVQGVDRFATAVDVMRTAAARPSTVFLARGDVPAGQVPADALAVSPLAYRSSTPVLLTERDRLPATTASAIVDAGVTDVVVLGGPAAVSADVAAAVDQLPGVSVQRVAGEDRSGTAAALADRAVASAGFSTTQIGLASGTSVDALSAGPVAGRAGYPLLLSSSATDLGDGARRYLAAHAATLTGTVVFGGEAAVTPALLAAAQSAASTATPPATPGPEAVSTPSGSAPPGGATPAASSPPPGGSGGSGSGVAPAGASSDAAVARYERFYVARDDARLSAYSSSGSPPVAYTLTEDDVFSRDGLLISRARFQMSWGRGLTVHTGPSGRRFDLQQEQVPSGGLPPVAELSADGATVEVSYPYQPEVEDPSHAVHYTSDAPDAAGALWHAAYRTTAPVLDEVTRRWTVRVAAPDSPGDYTYRVMTNLGESSYVWAWGHSADPVRVAGPGAVGTVRYTGDWVVEHVTGAALVASQGDVMHSFTLGRPAPGSAPTDGVDLLEDAVPGASLAVDYREGDSDNLLALSGPASDRWRLAAKDVRVVVLEGRATVSWTNPHGRVLTGVRVVDAPWWLARPQGDTDFRRLTGSTDPALLRAGAEGRITFPYQSVDGRSRDVHVVLDGAQGVSSISRGVNVYTGPSPTSTGTPSFQPPEPFVTSGPPVPTSEPPATSAPEEPDSGDADTTSSATTTPSAAPTTAP